MKLAMCGDDCDLCPRYLATRSGDERELKRIAEIWQRAGWRTGDVQPREMTCTGCSPQNQCIYSIAQCAAEKGIESCGVCAEYPCPKISEAFAKTDLSAQKCKTLFPAELYDQLRRAFFLKKAHLDAIHRSESEKMKLER